MRLTNVILSLLLFALSSSAGGSLTGQSFPEKTSEDQSTPRSPITVYHSYKQLSKELPLEEGDLMKVKVYNALGERIAKWQGKGRQVKTSLHHFAETASVGKYQLTIFMAHSIQDSYLVIK